jgi:hypothetical protein
MAQLFAVSMRPFARSNFQKTTTPRYFSLYWLNGSRCSEVATATASSLLLGDVLILAPDDDACRDDARREDCDPGEGKSTHGSSLLVNKLESGSLCTNGIPFVFINSHIQENFVR